MINSTFASLFPTLTLLLERGYVQCGFAIRINLTVDEIEEVFDMERHAKVVAKQYEACSITCGQILTRFERSMEIIAMNKKRAEAEAKAKEIEECAKLLVDTSIKRYVRWHDMRPNQRPAWEDYNG